MKCTNDFPQCYGRAIRGVCDCPPSETKRKRDASKSMAKAAARAAERVDGPARAALVALAEELRR